jgi:hypothetical protein
VAQFSLPIFESTATQFVAADFWIGSDTVKLDKKLVLDRPILGEKGNGNQLKDNPKGESWLNGQTYVEQKMNEHMHKPLLKKHERF